jgi:hypothetical protein
LDGFLTAYRETMMRVTATDYYFFNDRYFAEFRAALGERLHLLVVEHERQGVTAGLFTECLAIVPYHLGGTHDEFLSAAPMNLLFHFPRTWFKDRGAVVIHLGGGVGAQQDSLFYFKAGSSSARVGFHPWRVVATHEVYRELVAQWCRETGPPPSRSFFPAY